MIRLIASDLDGTLLSARDGRVSERMFGLIREMKRRGIRFCAASGRQYDSLLRLFAPVRDDVLYLCENGAVVFLDGRVIAKTPMPRAMAEAMTEDVLAREDCEVLISGERTSYLIPKREDYVELIRTYVGNRTAVVRGPEEIGEEIIKVSAYCRNGVAACEGVFLPKWGPQCSAVVSGEQWIDMTVADKGTALRQISRTLGIPPEDMLSFGDNFNDLPMFAFTGRSRAMAWAAREVRLAATRTCSGVEDELEAMFARRA